MNNLEFPGGRKIFGYVTRNGYIIGSYQKLNEGYILEFYFGIEINKKEISYSYEDVKNWFEKTFWETIDVLKLEIKT